MYLSKFLAVTTLFLCAVSCEHDSKSPAFDQQLLIGQWELDEAWRNNKRTETLEGTFYEFVSDGTMRTNFNPEMQMAEYPYEFNEKGFVQKSEPEAVFQIDSLTTTTLVVSTSLNNHLFKLALAKKAQSEVDPEATDL